MSPRRTLWVFLSVIAALTACRGNPVASVSEPQRMLVQKWAGDGQSAPVAAPVPVQPSVRVVGEKGEPIPGVAVTFRAGGGSGSVTGANSSTNSDGIATVGAWMLGERAGPDTLFATVADLAPVLFDATGMAGPPAGLTKVAGDNAYGDPSAAVAVAVLVQDAHANPVAGVSVTFSVTSGGGQVVGATQTTDPWGTARPGAWRLGPTPGPNTLEAAIEGLPAVTFTVIAATSVALCQGGTVPYTFGAGVDGALSLTDCRSGSGEFTDLYSASASTATSLRFDMSSPDFSSHVSLFDTAGAQLASSPYYCPDYCVGTNSVRVLLPAGDYIVGAGGFTYDYDDVPKGGVVGPYSLSSTVVPEDVGSCSAVAPVFIVPGATTTQRIETTDCADPIRLREDGHAYYYDEIRIYMAAGRAYTISMSSADFDTFLELWDWEDWGRLEFNDDFGGSSNSQITFTPTWSGQYVIHAATHALDATGSYTLTVQ
jgi:hypothetical protein